MQTDEIITRLTGIFRALFENDTLQLTPETSPEEIRGWDSMANVTLLIEIEHEFKIRIKPAQMEAMQNVGDLVELIKRLYLPAAS